MYLGLELDKENHNINSLGYSEKEIIFQSPKGLPSITINVLYDISVLDMGLRGWLEKENISKNNMKFIIEPIIETVIKIQNLYRTKDYKEFVKNRPFRIKGIDD